MGSYSSNQIPRPPRRFPLSRQEEDRDHELRAQRTAFQGWIRAGEVGQQHVP